MFKIALYEPSVEEISLTKLFLQGASTGKELRALEECTDEAIVSSMVRLVSDVDFPRHPTHTQHRKSNIGHRIIEYLNIPEHRLDSVRMRNIFYLTRSALTKELVVAFYPLLIHTRFNASALREVNRAWVTDESGIYTLKGYKSKSDQETPLIDITRESQAAYEAIELLLWNFDQLKLFRHIGEHEERLWFAWDQTSKEQLSSPISNFQKVKKLLLHRLGMDWFSDDQVRTHMLVLDRIKGGASVQSLRDGAGHKTESTTSIYFMNIASMRHSSSINLEFQRRIDSTIKFELSNERRFFADKFDSGYVDKNLLFPIGDGTSCTSPFEPPDPAWLVNAVCDAKSCHAGKGCPRNEIVLGKQRVMEVWTTSLYYAASWKRLLAENEDAFQKWHGPSMIFNLVLKKYIRDSSYWPLVEPIVRSYEKKGET
ncbi:hypothetical protein [Burkholderia vietnamiensis]|uniref:hypothetical protein n=1 Tax=Burkholderia vietnamiensis TaxID=60552 RepID=UPI001CF2F164|nr:hypothetical protein [Burkholderia vietnamiensis]MCA8183856.1 hypothetical protein [Burkholderia vietnamiensis]